MVREVAVAVTEPSRRSPRTFARLTPTELTLFGVPLLLIALLWSSTAQAAILPEDRADVMYHGYDGGGLEVGGPSVLVRKGIDDKVSVWANYYVDMITSASIDVVATASEYTEERKETSAGIDYLRGKTIMSAFYLRSDESDYTANAAGLSISQSFFGDLTTLSMSYAMGWDEVRRNGDDVFEDEIERQAFRIDVSQILTKNMIVSLNYEAITDEGFLNNPYRQVRFLDGSGGFSWEAELYPRTKTSHAVAVRGMYYLPYRAALKAEYRSYGDTWGIDAFNAEIAYVHPFDNGVTVEARYRYYSQTAADFYADLFPRAQAQNFLARDKELSTMQTNTLGLGVAYEFGTGWLPGFDKGEVNLTMDYMQFNYDDFRDVTVSGATPGEEPLYSFDSWVTRAFISFWY